MRVWLRRPLVGVITIRTGICDHRQIDGRDRPAKAGVRQMARSTGHVPEGGHILVVIQQAPEYSYRIISSALKYWRVTFPLGIAQNRRRQCLPLCEIAIEDGLNFASNSVNLRLQIGRENSGRDGVRQRWIRVVGWEGDVRLEQVWGLGGGRVRNAQDPEDRGQTCCYHCGCVSAHRLPSSALIGSR